MTVRHRSSICWILVAAAVVFASPAAAVQTSQTVPDAVRDSSAAAIQRFENQIAADVAADGVASIVAAVFVGNSVIWAGGFGWADAALHTPAGVETIYRTGSISKTFTAVLLMQLVERGVVALDDPVVRHFPEFAQLDGPEEQVRSITFRQLASHTGGLVREPELPFAASGPLAEWESKVLAAIPTTSLQSQPGSEYSYSNIGFGILGLAISRAAGRPFMDLVSELIFEPLGMTQSTFALTPDLEPYMSVGYANRDDGTIDAEYPAREHAGRGYKVPNGGVYSTVGDLARFAAALSGASPMTILSARARREMLTIQTPEDSTRGYGLGLSIQTADNGVRLVGHGGSVSGYNAHMVFDPETTIGVVLLRNYGMGGTNLGRAARGLAAELAGITSGGR
jgi:CubicO group peptidase (beta-lactamase class C family)